MYYSRSFKLRPYWKKWKRWIQRAEKGKTPKLLGKAEWKLGGQSVILRPEVVRRFIKEDLDKIYSRNGLTLKIFRNAPLPPEAHMYNATWGHNPVNDPSHLVDTSKIQNYHAVVGLAPRVFDLVFLEEGDRKYAAQVTEFIEGGRPRYELDITYQE